MVLTGCFTATTMLGTPRAFATVSPMRMEAVRQAKTSFSLGLAPVFSRSSLCVLRQITCVSSINVSNMSGFNARRTAMSTAGEEAAFPEVGEVHEEEGVLSSLLLRPADGPGHGLPPDALLPELVVAA